jgi:hypothetical protein
MGLGNRKDGEKGWLEKEERSKWIGMNKENGRGNECDDFGIYDAKYH